MGEGVPLRCPHPPTLARGSLPPPLRRGGPSFPPLRSGGGSGWGPVSDTPHTPNKKGAPQPGAPSHFPSSLYREARFAALTRARSEAVTMSASMPTPNRVRSSLVFTST
ncbi:hypothetical protein D3869_04525 [Azospirillum brasilense]|uniref:Uncharacterized protein n=1 Tax=Azospirillum brasilense TaxID=192 RepID=A0A4D8R5S3_AZOBR|nr:hypothetical protein D3869_04525 [Azospirillum brasilense]